MFPVLEAFKRNKHINLAPRFERLSICFSKFRVFIWIRLHEVRFFHGPRPFMSMVIPPFHTICLEAAVSWNSVDLLSFFCCFSTPSRELSSINVSKLRSLRHTLTRREFYIFLVCGVILRHWNRKLCCIQHWLRSFLILPLVSSSRGTVFWEDWIRTGENRCHYPSYVWFKYRTMFYV